ncbi:cytochrome P450 [Rhizopogon salebrosus TDB-379]|nr:cytochrome P450 [Rhizopogon salebrosus TDB-379]
MTLSLPMLGLVISDQTTHIVSAAICLGAVIAIFARAYLSKSESSLPLPPSPPTWRLWGHILPPRNPFLTVAEWIDEHGPVVTIRSGTEKIVIIGRHDAAVDIMEKQGASVADRPRMIAGGEMFTGGLSILFAPVGDRFRRMRKALHTHLHHKAAEAYQPLQMSHAKNTVLSILSDPYFQDHATIYAAATIMKITYGKNTPTSATDPEVLQIRQIIRVLRTVLAPGAYLVDTIPWLRYFPWYGQGLKQEFEKSRQLYTTQLNRVKQQMQGDVDVGPSFARYMLENDRLHGLTEIEMAFLAGTFFGAGSETTSGAICTVLMAAACFPEEQAEVQAELDAVIGRHRAPTFADQPSLPRLQAFIFEALRWRPLIPNGLPHRTTQDVVWGNYCIPAGTTVVGNHWVISRDPEVYPKPHSFKPQRWIDDQGRLRDDLRLPIFGFGRRICPGLHVANKSVFINSLLIFWAFQLTPDPTRPLDDMCFINGMPNDRACRIDFKTRIPEVELRSMMEGYPGVE